MIAGFAGPLGVAIAALGVTHVVSLDAWDIALGFQGKNGLERLAALRTHRRERFIGVGAGAAMLLVLGSTIIGLVVWLPAMVCGAALAAGERAQAEAAAAESV